MGQICSIVVLIIRNLPPGLETNKKFNVIPIFSNKADIGGIGGKLSEMHLNAVSTIEPLSTGHPYQLDYSVEYLDKSTDSLQPDICHLGHNGSGDDR